MAKKKTKKEPKKDNSYKIELIGLLISIAALIGIIEAGPVGIFITNFAVFLTGTWYVLLLLALIFIGIYLIVKRQAPDFLNSRLIGLYIIILCILTLSHVKYIVSNDLTGMKDVIEETVNIFMHSVGNKVEIMNISNLCGGIIGAFFASLLNSLLATSGTIIVTFALLLGGIMMLTDSSIIDIFKKVTGKIQSWHHNIKSKVPVEREEPKEEEVKEEKAIVLTLSDLNKLAKTSKPAPTIEPKEEEIVEKEEVEIKDKNYVYPPISLLKLPSKNSKNSESKETIENNKKIIEQVLKDFNIVGEVINYNIGPAVTQYEISIKSGTKVSKIASLNKEIALALAAKDVRIEAPIPGKSTIGIEIPNKVSSMVSVRELLEVIPPKLKNSKLLVTLGRDIMGRPVYMEINKTPHLLVAGSTGSGKSVCINSIIISILMRARPDEVKLVLVDPKKVELSIYNCIPHLYTPVVTDAKKANIVLKNIVVEMENRYDLFSQTGTKNISGYNEYVDEQNKNRSNDNKLHKLPFVVVIIDELADLMLVAAKEVEDSIMRITQMARAAGIHLIVATQRPSTDVITGVVKANIPSRISFAVASNIDSRTILDMTGAEKLLGKGDMLFKPQGENIPIRVQGTFLDDNEIKRVVEHTIKEQKAQYNEHLLEDREEGKTTTMVEDMDATEEPLYNDMVEFIKQTKKASTSSLQRRFKIGFNRAARAMDLLEERGIVGPSVGSKPREILIDIENDED